MFYIKVFNPQKKSSGENKSFVALLAFTAAAAACNNFYAQKLFSFFCANTHTQSKQTNFLEDEY
jgi:hypothetical protein